MNPQVQLNNHEVKDGYRLIRTLHPHLTQTNDSYVSMLDSLVKKAITDPDFGIIIPETMLDSLVKKAIKNQQFGIILQEMTSANSAQSEWIMGLIEKDNSLAGPLLAEIKNENEKGTDKPVEEFFTLHGQLKKLKALGEPFTRSQQSNVKEGRRDIT